MIGPASLRILVGFAIVLALGLIIAEAPAATASHGSTPGVIDFFSIDVDPSSSPANTSSSLGSREDCIAVAPGATFDIDITVDEIDGASLMKLFGFGLSYDPAELEIVGFDTDELLGALAGSTVFDLSNDLPDDGDGSFALGGNDASGPHESGEGVLARVTFSAVGSIGSSITFLGGVISVVYLDQFNVARSPLTVEEAAVSIGGSDFDGDGIFDICDADDDNDLIGDSEEVSCGSDPLDAGSIPERVDGIFAGVDDDGDLVIDEPLPGGASAFDCDGDGYTGTAEDNVYSYVGQTDGDQKTCQEYDTTFSTVDPNQTSATPSLRWPSDFNSSASPLDSFNKITILDIVSFIAPVKYYATDVGTHPGDVRWDLTPGDAGVFPTDINIQDITTLIAASSGRPPMLGGAKALGGPVCPWEP